MNHRRVVIAGMGVVSPLGNTVESTWHRLVAGDSAIGRITAFDPSPFKSQIAAEVRDFDPEAFMERREARRSDRYTQFAVAAAEQAIASCGLAMARGMILAGDADYVLVVGSETLLRYLDWGDRATCVLFGDGAGALLLAASEEPGGLLSCALGSDGSGGDLLILPAGGSANPASLETVTSRQHYVRMDGKAVFRFATRVMAEGTRDVVVKAGWSLNDIDLVIPHQANQRIIPVVGREAAAHS